MNIQKKIKTLDFKLSKILNGALFWAYKSKFSWNWMEFEEHKEYNFWDSLKDIDWKASAKTENMYVKKYELEKDLNVLFILDNSFSMKFWSQEQTKKEILIEIFYSLAMSAYYNNDNIWAIIFDEEKLDFINYKKSRNNIYKILEEILSHPLIPSLKTKGREKKNFEKNKLQKIFSYLINRRIKNNLIFILTDQTENIDEKSLKMIWENNEIIFINIFDIFEKELVNIDWNISFNFWKNFLNINLDKKKNLDYKKRIEKKIKILEETFRKNRIWYIEIDTKSDIFSKLLWYFNNIK